MAEDTRWSDLRQLCSTNGCSPVFRAETFGDQVRYSLAARSKRELVYDIRLERAWDEASGAPEELLDRALGEWWQ